MNTRIVKTLEGLLNETAKTETGCMEWQRAINTDGYPRVVWAGKKCNGKVHRIVYELSHVGEDITDKVIRHTCDNTRCLNPDHLLSGSVADNIQDREDRNRGAKKAQFSKDQVLLIRKLYADGWGQTKLSHLFNVSQGAIRSIVIRQSYKYYE